ncbi:putative membrane protein [Corynebacterium aurimucosum ATCC 700975]|uniref:Putative membrane protein n=2 Tax=Corynebacterium aurimucosum TaxID=169292 RepID=C3PLA4_CORA7|nr:putative membrane protein [Corynebacterium aurimucosum ATCC 700975]
MSMSPQSEGSPRHRAQRMPRRPAQGRASAQAKVAPPVSLANPHDAHLKPSALPSAIQWLAIGLFVVAVVVSGFYAVFEHWRRATLLLGGALMWLAVVRLTCDSSRVGVLAVRSRRFDACFTGILGAAMAFLAFSIDALGS